MNLYIRVVSSIVLRDKDCSIYMCTFASLHVSVLGKLRNVLYLELPITQTLFSFQTRFGLVVYTSCISICAKLSVIKGFVTNFNSLFQFRLNSSFQVHWNQTIRSELCFWEPIDFKISQGHALASPKNTVTNLPQSNFWLDLSLHGLITYTHSYARILHDICIPSI